MEIKRQKWIIEDERGKRPGQKYKSLLVMQYILKYADDEHPVTIADIEGHLLKYGIEAERYHLLYHAVCKSIPQSAYRLPATCGRPGRRL